jgi:hypothetical protein
MKQSPSWEVGIRLTVKKFPAFAETEGSLPCSQAPAIGRYCEPPESSPHRNTLPRIL